MFSQCESIKSLDLSTIKTTIDTDTFGLFFKATPHNGDQPFLYNIIPVPRPYTEALRQSAFRLCQAPILFRCRST